MWFKLIALKKRAICSKKLVFLVSFHCFSTFYVQHPWAICCCRSLQMERFVLFQERITLCSFAHKKPVIRSKNQRANSQPWKIVKVDGSRSRSSVLGQGEGHQWWVRVKVTSVGSGSGSRSPVLCQGQGHQYWVTIKVRVLVLVRVEVIENVQGHQSGSGSAWAKVISCSWPRLCTVTWEVEVTCSKSNVNLMSGSLPSIQPMIRSGPNL